VNEEAPLGTFEEQVLLAIVRTDEDAFGMNVRREIEDVTGRDVAIGAVYATLDRLEAKRLVRSWRGDVGDGRSRRLFALTRQGAVVLANSRAMRERLWRGVSVTKLLAEP
jgi:PadR family transcriptional regulator, regulatory protein PadR